RSVYRLSSVTHTNVLDCLSRIHREISRQGCNPLLSNADKVQVWTGGAVLSVRFLVLSQKTQNGHVGHSTRMGSTEQDGVVGKAWNVSTQAIAANGFDMLLALAHSM
ncbi:hypothetical protein EXIGLDRAFT_716854, partial [Exidia glandulosa HHB12029]